MDYHSNSCSSYQSDYIMVVTIESTGNSGTLYIVATPIGNLEDLSSRAVRVLRDVNLIAAEDTRHSRKLLTKFGITTRLTSFHHHNQGQVSARLIERLVKGEDIALVSDAGTPLISDPGALLVAEAHRREIRVVPIPGASALTCALSVSGLQLREVLFLGFLPAKRGDRRKQIKHLLAETRCLVFFEAPHRILASLQDMTELFGDECRAVLAREMTKIHETIRVDNLGNLTEWMLQDSNRCRGEFVIVIDNTQRSQPTIQPEIDRTLEILLEECSPSKAAELSARILKQKRNVLYRRALELKKIAY